MDIVHKRAAGVDISKRDAKVCLRVPGVRAGTLTSSVTTWGSTTGQILALRDFHEREHVTTVVMESTSDHWKPYFYLLEETLPVMLVNAKAARNIRGRKPMSPLRLAGPVGRARAAQGFVRPAGADL